MADIYTIDSVRQRLKGVAPVVRTGRPLGELTDFAGVLRAELLRTSAGSAAPSDRPSLVEMPAWDAGAGQGVDLQEISRTTEDRARDFQEKLTAELRARGISAAEGIVLSLDQTGQVVVGAGHPQAAEIRRALEANPDLRNELIAVAEGSSFLRAAKEHSVFSDLFGTDPKAAAERFVQVAGDLRNERFTMSIGSGGVRIFFTSIYATLGV